MCLVCGNSSGTDTVHVLSLVCSGAWHFVCAYVLEGGMTMHDTPLVADSCKLLTYASEGVKLNLDTNPPVVVIYAYVLEASRAMPVKPFLSIIGKYRQANPTADQV